ncbi:MAG: hypothetical protein E6I91_20320 [Chloroflexi bacterium]|nr:MAG: hypothetical protein E6I91_20320 [Chloroflexota bacterium]
MTESITQQDTSNNKEAEVVNTGLDQKEENQTRQFAVSLTSATVIWTPRFIVLFALALVIGLSVDSLLTQVWSSRLIRAPWILLFHLLLLFTCLIATTIISRSRWIRMGGVFGSIWIIFTGVNSFLPLFVRISTLELGSPIPSLLNATISSALLGAFICLSIEHTLLTKWDIWFFRLALIGSTCAILLIYFITPSANHSLNVFESDVAALALVLSLLVWWARPTCWKVQPCPTLLFGLVPAIELLLSIPSIGKGTTNFYLTQVSLLCFLLGFIRLLQGELRR